MIRNKVYPSVLDLQDLQIQLRITIKRKRHVSFRFKQGILWVSAPTNTTLDAIKQALLTKETWIRKHYAMSQSQVVPEGQIQVLGRRVMLTETIGSSFDYHVSENELILTRPSRMRPETALSRFKSDYAEKVLLTIFQEASREMGLKPKSVTVRLLKSSHGRCSSKQDITLSSGLIAYDPAYIRYVCIHELAHLVHMNHSPDFYALVMRYCPNYKALVKAVRMNLSNA